MTAVDYRLALKTLMEQSVACQEAHGNYIYAEVRPQNVQYTVAQLTTPIDRPTLDCSDGVRALCHAVGVPDDPAGNNYAPWGNSSSIFMHLEHVDLADAEIGDVITFGRWSGEEHACMVYDLTDKTNPTVWNHGGPGQPGWSTLGAEQADHTGVFTVCRLRVPPIPVTPQDKLRAMTGWFSWAAWRLGEGPWKDYGKLNKTVRPDVPTVIPPTWWARYAQFLANRKKPNTA